MTNVQHELQTHTESNNTNERSDKLNQAKGWLSVSDAIVQARMKQLAELGAPDASSPTFFGPQRAFLDMVREKLDAGDPAFVDMFSQLESDAHSQSDSPATYDLEHVKQIDFFATMVDQAQAMHDDGLVPSDPLE